MPKDNKLRVFIEENILITEGYEQSYWQDLELDDYHFLLLTVQIMKADREKKKAQVFTGV